MYWLCVARELGAHVFLKMKSALRDYWRRERERDVMKSPTFLITIRNAVGVMLVLAALSTVVLSTISLPGDKATAQVADDASEVAVRAEAWWSALTPEERTNAFNGKEWDEDGTTTDVRDLPSSASLAYSALDDTATNGQIGKDTVNTLVDGSTASETEIYAVGDQHTEVQAIRKFQSVKLWWNHLDCTEARAAVGEDNGTLLRDIDSQTDGIQNEPSDVCAFVGAATDATVIAYNSLGDTAKAQVNEVGNALLGLTNGGSYSEARSELAERWWNELSELSARQRVNALYGDALTLGIPTANTGNQDVSAGRSWITTHTYEELFAGLTYTVSINNTPTELPLDADSKALVQEIKALIYDRATLIYGDGGSGGKYEGVDTWWDSVGCLERIIALGIDNEPNTASSFCNAFGSLVDDQDRNGTTQGTAIGGRGVSDRERAMTMGRVLLNLDDIPAVEAWWNKLGELPDIDHDGDSSTAAIDRRVLVVYGNPPMRTEYDADGDPSTTEDNQTTTVTDADKDVFRKPYDMLGRIEVAGNSALSTHLPTRITTMLARNGMEVDNPDSEDTDGDQVHDLFYYSAKRIVDTIATEIFDPPLSSGADDNNTGSSGATVTDDDEFDPPYLSVGDWWENLDCRTMRMAVGEDNDYLDADTDLDTTGDQPETSIYCGHLPGAAAATATNTVSADVQTRIETVGKALLARSEIGRPSFNEEVAGAPTISGEAYVGSVLTANTGGISDEDGTGTYSYQWLRTTNPTVEIAGATSKTYTVQVADIGATLSVRVSYTDGERYPESTTSALTNVVAGSLGKISKIEPAIRGVTVSGGDVVALAVNIYGVQGDIDNTLSGTISWSVDGTSIEGSGRELVYTAPSSPATYMVKATLDEGDCRPKDEADRDTACSAEFEVKVRRPAAAQPAPEAPVNPPGEIPSIIADSDGNQYEVFTPVEGGTFTGEGVTVSAEPGAVPNGEIIGVRAEASDEASNAGQTHHRVTLDGRYYTVAATDASGEPVNAYRLDDPVTVCIPLPARLAANISDVTIVSMRDDGTFAILASQVKLTTSGTTLCGQLSELSATVAAAHLGSPSALPTPTPEPTPETPDTGGTAPGSNGILWVLALGITTLALSSTLLITRRRKAARNS